MSSPGTEASLNAEQLRELEQRLLKLREQAAGTVSARLHGHGLLRREEAGLPRRSDDTDDDAAAETQREADVNQLSRNADALAGIDTALARIESGDYGVCSDCGVDIALQRLMAQPAALRCAKCQTEVETRAAAAGGRG